MCLLRQVAFSSSAVWSGFTVWTWRCLQWGIGASELYLQTGLQRRQVVFCRYDLMIKCADSSQTDDALCSRCEVDIDECESDPCRNGGVCVNRHNHYLCECVSDFSGENCENTVSSWLLFIHLMSSLSFCFIDARKPKKITFFSELRFNFFIHFKLLLFLYSVLIVQ